VKLYDLNITVEILTDKQLARELKISLSSDNSLLQRYILSTVENEELSLEFFDDFSEVPLEISNFIRYFKNYRQTLIGKPDAKTLLIGTPVDFYFLHTLLKFSARFIINEKKRRISFDEETYTLRLLFNNELNSLVLPSPANNILLPTNAGNLLISEETIRPLTSPVSDEMLETLFREGAAPISPELKIKLFTTKRDRAKFIDRMIELPQVRTIAERKIRFRFKAEKDFYSVAGFLNTGDRECPLNFPELRKAILLSEEIILPCGENEVVLISPDTEFYQQIRTVVNEVYSNFFEFLNEIETNKIETRDNENLFQKFFPKVQDIVEIIEGDETIEIVSGQISERRIKITDEEQIPSGDGSSIDWLGVDFQFQIGDIMLMLNELHEILRHGFVRKGNRIVSLGEKELSFVKDLLDEIDIRKMSGKWRMRRFNLPRLLQESIKTELPGALKEFPKELNADRSIKKVKLPGRISHILRNYQKLGADWLHFLNTFHFGGILADEMGLGKTVQMLTHLYTIKGNGPALIVCPSSLTYNWVAEIKKFFPDELSWVVVDGNKSQRTAKIAEISSYDIAITSYYLVHLDIEEYRSIEFNYCILDEAQHIKNKSAKRTQSIKDILSRHRIAITGTPIENNVTELWSIFDFVMPSFLGHYGWFKKSFEIPINGFDRNERTIAVNKLRKMIHPFIIRRTKSAVIKELPDKIEQSVSMELTERQKALYLETLSKVRNNLYSVIEKKGIEGSYIDFLAALTRLRQICLHPGLVNPELIDLDSEEISVKTNALVELLEEAMDSGHRVLVFSQFVQMLKILRKELSKNQIDYLYLDGETKDRVELVDRFNRSDVPVFLISLRAGGTGLNLIGADAVILFDPWWNPAVENQAIDRAHRIGQVNVVHVYRLMTQGTIEEKIARLQEKKRVIFDNMLDKDATFIKKMTWEDIRDLFEMET
jgi:SNF2 family DNA or RNA helicase